MLVELASPEDRSWIEPIFKTYENWLGKGFFGTIWYRYWKSLEEGSVNEFWTVIRPFAFAHWKIRKKDKTRVLYEIATDAGSQRSGFARALIEHMGKPIQLKTDINNELSNGFYERLGFTRVATSKSRDQKRKFYVYQAW